MCMQSNKERGAVLVMAAIFSVVLIGIAALAVDAGRLFVLNSEMHNAADAAALAAAAELDGSTGARQRAVAAARTLLSHTGHFSTDSELLDEALTYDSDPEKSNIIFYCKIGSKPDIENDPECAGSKYPNTADNTTHYLATSDSDSHYVKVSLQTDSDETYYVIDLFFLPVLNLLPSLSDVASTATAHAEATAGRQNMICNYPPLMICDPFECEDGEDPEEDHCSLKYALEPGQQIQLKAQGPSSAWVAGNFGFLQPTAGPGTPNLAAAMGDEKIQGCTSRFVTSSTGEVTTPVTKAFNTRFDLYDGYSATDYPPAPNVIDYPDDEATVSYDNCDPADDSCRIGNGTWPIEEYFNNFHTTSLTSFESDTGIDRDDAMRYDVYLWEIENELPCWQPYWFKGSDGSVLDPPWDSLNCALPNPSASIPGTGSNKAKMGIYKTSDEAATPPYHRGTVDAVDFAGVPASDLTIVDLQGHGPVVDGKPGNDAGDSKRRVLYVATLTCGNLDINGFTPDIPVFEPDGFAKIFLIRHSLGSPFADIDGEYIGWSDNTEANYRVKIQLYE